MKAIALTGSIGSGKSTVLKFVRSLRIATVDCDTIVSKLYREKEVQKSLLRLFGTANRKEISSIVFASPLRRRKLEKALHPLVWREVRSRLDSLRKQGKSLAIVEVPLLFEAKWEKRFDSTIFVKAPRKKCIQRLVKRGMPRKQVLQRWKAQLSPGKKIKKAQRVIDNSGSPAKTRVQVKGLMFELAKQ